MLINKETNLLIDKYVKSVTGLVLKKSRLNCLISFLDLKYSQYKKWVERYFPDYLEIHKHILRKKLIELYSSFILLTIGEKESYLDAAGGKFTYIGKIKCRQSFLQDINIPDELKSIIGEKVQFIKSSVEHIPLKTGSINCISCHHSFEHFQNDVDIKFIKEIERLLSRQGRCVIIPIIIGDKYIELTNLKNFKKHFDPEAVTFLDGTATLPGREQLGYFARIYNIKAFKRRVLNIIDKKRFSVHIFEIRMNGVRVPHMKKICNYRATKINYPYRALYIKRKNSP